MLKTAKSMRFAYLSIHFVHRDYSLRLRYGCATYSLRLFQAFAALTVILTFFKQRPCFSIYFLPTAAKSKQKVPRSNLFLVHIENSLQCQNGER
ncbi:hypothetical protein RS130_08885 [Paraglaciecola aquimarina]|uniref:Uncharacterized protein n=1 Tax=Paraglaciecola aquimarina TaxID=1235557 RepID=A0ABU3SVK6_9ALTE|nr:hypothetical protein [Paraglaciecola aquimarina]MDU0354034.1 hypothetical protein [Paraglaciecola aquimarina]